MPPQGQKIIGYDPDSGKAIVGYDPNTGKMVYADASMPPVEQRTTGGDLLDVGKGFVKGGARLALDLGSLALDASGSPSSSILRGYRSSDTLKPTNQRQQAGMFGFDVGSMATPAGWESAGSRA